MNTADKAKQLPSSPGVYLMKDSSGSIIYVGKSKNLKNRVQSYFQNSKNHTKKVEKLVHHLKDFDFIVTDTEFEAFLLECKLIKEYRPFYNKLMKNPERYAYIRIHMEKGMELSSQMNKNDHYQYFGPYTSKSTAEKALQGLKDFYKINCGHPSGKTQCLNYSLGLCIGMCFDRTANEKYKNILKKIIHFFEGSERIVLEEMEQQMKLASEYFDFERAAKIRDDLEWINSLLKKEKVIEFTGKNKNLVIIEQISEKVTKLFLIKGNKILFNQKAEWTESLPEWIKLKILDCFNFESHPSTIEIGKERIDEAQIIYSYLKSSSCKFVEIPEKWLLPKNQNKIDNALNNLLKIKKRKISL